MSEICVLVCEEIAVSNQIQLLAGIGAPIHPTFCELVCCAVDCSILQFSYFSVDVSFFIYKLCGGGDSTYIPYDICMINLLVRLSPTGDP